MHQSRLGHTPRVALAAFATVMLVAACSGGGASPTATSAPSTSAPTSAPPASASASAAPASATPLAVDCSQATLVTPGTLTVATYGTGLPDILVNADGTLGALEGALLNGLAKDCNLQIKLYQTTFASMILAVQQDKADIATYIYYSTARSKVMYYTYPHWVADHAVVFYRSDFNYTGPSSCKTAGTATGFVWAPFLQQALGSNAKLFPDTATGGTALLNSQIDCWINGETSVADPPFDTATGKYKTTRLQVGDFGMDLAVLNNDSYNTVACNNKPLANAVNAELTNQVNSGAWAQVMAQNNVPSDAAPTLQSPQQGC